MFYTVGKKEEIKRTIFLLLTVRTEKWQKQRVWVSQRISHKENPGSLDFFSSQDKTTTDRFQSFHSPSRTQETKRSVFCSLNLIQESSQWRVFFFQQRINIFLNNANIRNIEKVIKFSNLPIFYTNVNIHIIGNIICVIFHTSKFSILSMCIFTLLQSKNYFL